LTQFAFINTGVSTLVATTNFNHANLAIGDVPLKG